MFTRLFWEDAFERAGKTAAQFALVIVAQDWLGWDRLQADLGNIVGAAIVGAIFSVLTSVATVTLTDHQETISPASAIPEKDET